MRRGRGVVRVGVNVPMVEGRVLFLACSFRLPGPCSALPACRGRGYLAGKRVPVNVTVEDTALPTAIYERWCWTVAPANLLFPLLFRRS